MIVEVMKLAKEAGDIREVYVGYTDMENVRKLEQILEESTEENYEEKKAEFYQVWKEIVKPLGVTSHDRHLELDQNTGGINEIVAVDEEIQEQFGLMECNLRTEEEVK